MAADFSMYIDRLLREPVIKQAAIIDLEGTMMSKSKSFEIREEELESFPCLFEYNTTYKKMELRFNRKVYKVKITESENFLFGFGNDQGLLALKTSKMYVFAIIKAEKDYAAARKTMNDLKVTMAGFGL